MAISFSWKGWSGSDWGHIINSTNVIAFFGPGGYGSPIQVGEYNQSMHIRASVSDDTDACTGTHLTALTWIGTNSVSINGASPVNLQTSITQNHLVKVTVTSDTDIAIIGSRIYAYDGTNVDNPPSNITFKGFKLGDAAWSQPHGRANYLNCGTSTTPATTHNFYVGFSMSPTSTGASSLFVVRFEVDIQ